MCAWLVHGIGKWGIMLKKDGEMAQKPSQKEDDTLWTKWTVDSEIGKWE